MNLYNCMRFISRKKWLYKYYEYIINQILYPILHLIHYNNTNKSTYGEWSLHWKKSTTTTTIIIKYYVKNSQTFNVTRWVLSLSYTLHIIQILIADCDIWTMKWDSMPCHIYWMTFYNTRLVLYNHSGNPPLTNTIYTLAVSQSVSKTVFSQCISLHIEASHIQHANRY